MNFLETYISWLVKLSKRRSRQGLYEFLSRQYALIHSNANVLAVGAGGEITQLLTEYAITNKFRIVSIDIDPARGPDIVGDVCNYQFSKNKFDFIVIPEVLEHLHSPSDALSNLHSALKQNGTMILTTPFILPMHDRPNDYFRFTQHGIELLLKKFHNVSVIPRNSYFEAIDVLWVRLLQTNQRSAYILCFFLIPLIFIIKRPITMVLSKLVATDAMTTGYVVIAKK